MKQQTLALATDQGEGFSVISLGAALNGSACFTLNRDDIATLASAVQITRPCLNHAGSFIQVLRSVVVCLAHLVAFSVGELSFDGVGVPAHFIQPHRGHAAETVAGHLFAGVA